MTSIRYSNFRSMKHLDNVDITNKHQIFMFDFLDIPFLVQFCARSWMYSNIHEPLPCIPT